MKLHITLFKVTLILLLCISFTLIMNSNTHAWNSGINDTQSNTHYWILKSGIDILRRNVGGKISSKEVELLDKWDEFIGRGISFADYNVITNAMFSYGSHFYDPDTGKSFIPTSTAKNRGIHYFEKAGKTYTEEKDYLRAFYYLGLSLHYLTDLTQPLHAANLSGISPRAPLYHAHFEDFAGTRQKYCLVTDNHAYWDYQGKDPGLWLQQTAIDAKKDFPNVFNPKIKRWYWKSSYNHSYTRRWQSKVIPTIEKRLTEAQRIVPGYIHLWFETYVNK